MMKVVLLNGSPHKDGCTYTALSEAARVLEDQGIDTEILQLGTRPVRGCIACGACSKTGRCTFDDDVANLWIDKIKEADGLIAGHRYTMPDRTVHSAQFLTVSFMLPAVRSGLNRQPQS